MKTISINFVTDARMNDALRKTAAADDRSVSSLVRLIIDDWYQGRPPMPRLRRAREKPEARSGAAA